jgi:hypothetical protein
MSTGAYSPFASHTFSHHDQIAKRIYLKEERFILAHGFTGFSPRLTGLWHSTITGGKMLTLWHPGSRARILGEDVHFQDIPHTH